VATASNGLTSIGHDIELGGPLIKNTTVTGNGNSLIINDNSVDNIDIAIFPGGVRLNAHQGGAGHIVSTMGTTVNDISLYHNEDDSTSSGIVFVMDATSAFIEDDINQLGLYYKADYTANQLANDRAVTDVGGIKQLIGTGVTASNGLTKTGDNISLGGTMDTQDVIIETDGRFFGVGDVGANTTVLSVQSGLIDMYVEGATSQAHVSASFGTAVLQSQLNVAGGVKSISIDENGMITRDTELNRGQSNFGDYEANFIGRSLSTVQLFTPVVVDDSLGIFTSLQCEAANAYSYPGCTTLEGLTVIYIKIANNNWINILKTDCL
jgi:hypothetical protein